MEIKIDKTTSDLKETIETLWDLSQTINKTTIDQLMGEWEIKVSIKRINK